MDGWVCQAFIHNAWQTAHLLITKGKKIHLIASPTEIHSASLERKLKSTLLKPCWAETAKTRILVLELSFRFIILILEFTQELELGKILPFKGM